MEYNTVEDMAADYIKAIREVQPNGPYRVCASFNCPNLLVDVAAISCAPIFCRLVDGRLAPQCAMR